MKLFCSLRQLSVIRHQTGASAGQGSSQDARRRHTTAVAPATNKTMNTPMYGHTHIITTRVATVTITRPSSDNPTRAMAHSQNAKAWELRSATSYAREALVGKTDKVQSQPTAFGPR